MKSYRLLFLLFSILSLSMPSVAPAQTNDDPVSSSGNALAEWMEQMVNKCWVCESLNTMSNQGLTLADKMYSGLSNNIATLLGLFMAIWLLGFASTMILPFGPGQQASRHWNQGAKKIFHFAIVLGFLQSSQFFWDYAFTPILSTGMAVAGSIMTLGMNSSQNNSYCSESSSLSESSQNISGVSGAETIMKKMNCPLSGIQTIFSEGIAIGIGTVYGPIGCQTKSDGSMFGDIKSVVSGIVNSLPGSDWFLNLIIAIPIIVIYFCGYIIYPLLIVDVLIRSIIIAIFSPIALSCSLFKQSHHIAHKAVWNLIQSGMTLIFTAIVGAIGQSAILATFQSLPVNAGYQLSDWSSLAKAISDPCNSGLHLSLFSMAYYQICGIGIIILFMLRKVSTLASDFTSAMSGDYSGAIAGSVAIPRLGMNALSMAAQMATLGIASGKTLASQVVQAQQKNKT